MIRHSCAPFSSWPSSGTGQKTLLSTTLITSKAIQGNTADHHFEQAGFKAQHYESPNRFKASAAPMLGMPSITRASGKSSRIVTLMPLTTWPQLVGPVNLAISVIEAVLSMRRCFGRPV
jgi:hypothetical protein